MYIDKRRLYHLDWYLILNGLALLGIGIINLISATRSFESGPYNLLIKQLAAFAVGLVLLFFILSYDYRLISSYSKHFYLGALGLIVIVILLGSHGGGAKRWISIAGIAFQPSELMKPVMVLLLANMLYGRKKENEPLNLRDLLLPLAYILVPCILVLLQPDLGTAVVILASCFCLLWFVGLTKGTYLLFGVVGLASIPLLWKFVMKPYQKMRVLNLINPELDPAGYGYHSIQAKIAVGSGGLFGKGYLNGTQHKLHFIPEHHTDFIFTVFGEEWGFIGSIILFLLFVSFIYRCLKISQSTSDPLGSMITFGIASIIFIQFTVNILMAINLAPVVGIPLPFISYGGSSMISMMIGVGFLLNVNMRRYMF
ncbi:MAG: Rod shape-determining protein RodA [Syntrophorhabdaceae bacterium PtaU1.Bin034]|jgi:rod shape determining protein RodA|nr:MAG: Rod shape-determining protein RodA [Syntrophorhabdaceae bacterium PtaU1.Bin034]